MYPRKMWRKLSCTTGRFSGLVEEKIVYAQCECAYELNVLVKVAQTPPVLATAPYFTGNFDLFFLSICMWRRVISGVWRVFHFYEPIWLKVVNKSHNSGPEQTNSVYFLLFLCWFFRGRHKIVRHFGKFMNVCNTFTDKHAALIVSDYISSAIVRCFVLIWLWRHR